MRYQDHFSGHAASYAEARPDYPAALFDWLASISPARTSAWDAGTGNGQAAVALAKQFERVIATDPSAEQIAHATAHPRVEYRVARAEDGIAEGSAATADPSGAGCASEIVRVDLVTAAQALHWFDRPAFYARVREVLQPGGVIAVWCYGLSTVTPPIDAVIADFYTNVVGPYWPADRKWIDEQYRTIEFPFAELTPPSLEMSHEWDLAQFLAYVRTWSAVRRYIAERGRDPVEMMGEHLFAEWGNARSPRVVRWRVHLRVGWV